MPGRWERSRAGPRGSCRGLRSFDRADVGFFLSLLHGPHTPEGLPESVAFWIHRLNRTDPSETFRVGLLYGPSGCGKTSLVKAGVLPRLDRQVAALYIEATADDTEASLLQLVRRKVPALPADLSLADSFAWLRRSAGTKWHGKVVVVLDQFEQWLHRPGELRDTELLRALRQCDGGALQALLLVRDDFWLPVSRFLRELEVSIQEGRNVALVDLFDTAHARRVLADCGRALGRLPDDLAQCSPQQQRFLDDAITMIAEDGRVIPVRLSILVELVKHAAWVPATLRARGGAEGLGEAFLDESFSTAAPAARREHENAARAVLQALLPDGATDIKGHSRSRAELQRLAGYENRSADFAALLQMLDQDLRLVTPTTPVEAEVETSKAERADPEYQLTHDFLVPSIRGWLTRGQRETWRGCAELLLVERAAEWGLRPEKRNLPGWAGWTSIRLFTRRERWSASQRRMMRAADRLHLRRTALSVLAGVVLVVGTLLLRSQFVHVRDVSRADALVAEIQNADQFQPGYLHGEVARYRPLVVPKLQAALQQKDLKLKEQIHVRLALLPYDPDQVDALGICCWRRAAPGGHDQRAKPHKGNGRRVLGLRAELVNGPGRCCARRRRGSGRPTTRKDRHPRPLVALTEQNLLFLTTGSNARPVPTAAGAGRGVSQRKRSSAQDDHDDLLAAFGRPARPDRRLILWTRIPGSSRVCGLCEESGTRREGVAAGAPPEGM